MENQDKAFENTFAQFQFLILEGFEQTDAPINYFDLLLSMFDYVREYFMKNFNKSFEKDGFSQAFSDTINTLCEKNALSLSGEDQEKPQLNKAENFEEYFSSVLAYIKEYYKINLEDDSAAFESAYSKLKSGDCLIPERKQSILLHCIAKYLEQDCYDNDSLTYDTQIEYLALREIYKWEQAYAKRKSKPHEVIGISVPEIAASLRKNKDLWHVRNLELDESAFDTKIQDILTRLENLKSENYKSGYVVANSPKELYTLYANVKNSKGKPQGKPFKITYTNIICNYKKYNTWRVDTDFNLYYSLLLQRLAGELEFEIAYPEFEDDKQSDSDKKSSPSKNDEVDINDTAAGNSYCNIYSWNYILTNDDIVELWSYFLPNQNKANEFDTDIDDKKISQYIQERNLVWEDPKSEDQLYAIKVINYKPINEQIYFILKKHNGEKTVISDPMDFSNTGNIVNLKKIGANINSGDLQPIIDTTRKKSKAGDLPVYYTCKTIGWDGDKVFVGSSIIKKDNEYPLFYSTYDTFSDNVGPECKTLLSAGDLSTWLDLCSEAMKTSIPSQAVIAASFSSAIVGALETGSIIINLCGDNGSGKSTIQKLAASVWSRTNDPRIIMSFNGTELGLLKAMNNNNGVSVSIDDKSMGDDSNKYIGFVYRLEEGLSRRSASKNSTLSSWHTSIILSSETSILKCHDEKTRGVLRRMFEFFVRQGTLTRDADQALKIKKVTGDNYGLAGPEFARYLIRHDIVPELQNRYDEKLEQIRKSTEDQRGSAQSMAERIAIIILTCDLVHDALGLPFETDKILEYLQDVVRRTLKSDVSREDAIKILKKILPDIEAASIHPNDDYYHVPTPVFDQIEKNLGYPPRSLRKILNQYGLTLKNKTGSSHNITDNKKSVKVISILKDVD